MSDANEQSVWAKIKAALSAIKDAFFVGWCSLSGSRARQKYVDDLTFLALGVARVIGFVGSLVPFVVVTVPVGAINLLTKLLSWARSNMRAWVSNLQSDYAKRGTTSATFSVLRALYCLSPLAVFAFGSIGLFEIGLATTKFFSKGGEDGSSMEFDAASALSTAISGIEFLLLALLPFLFLRSLSNYVKDLTPEANPSKEARIALTEAKALSIALLFSIVATHLVGKLIGSIDKRGLELEEAGVGAILLVLLGGFYIFLEKSIHEQEANQKDGTDPVHAHNDIQI